MRIIKHIYLIGQSIRNPSLKKHLKFLQKTDAWSIEQLEDYQNNQFLNLVEFCFNYNPFYKKYFKENDIFLSDIKSIKDINKFPILSKDDLIENNVLLHANFRFNKKFRAITSGSSGKTLSFLRDENADSFNRASIQRGYSWYNVYPWEKNGYFWGFDFSFFKKMKTIFFDTLQNRFRLFTYSSKSLKHFLTNAQKASYLHGYSSMIYQLAVIINKDRLAKPQNLKMIKGTSEKIFESYQDEISQAFGQKMISEYGATEAGIIAFECPNGYMHINMEGVYIEEIEKEIVVTNLQMKSFPIIRYKLGDYIKLAANNERCSCGKAHHILKEVIGRIGKSVIGERQIYPSLYFYYIFKNLAQHNKIEVSYQVIQQEKGKLIINIDRDLASSERESVANEFKKYFNDDIAFTLNENINLINDKQKQQSFISKL